MKTTKKSIKESIFLSHISIIVISVILTSIIFNICLNLYVRRQTKKQLTTAAELVKKSMSTEILNSNIVSNSSKEDREFVKSFLKINRILKQAENFLDINYAIVGKNDNLLYPRENQDASYDVMKEDILPVLKRKNLNALETDKTSVVRFKVNGEEYSAILYPLKLEDGSKFGYLLLYSDLNKSNKLIITVNVILLSILLITGVIALIISGRISRKLANPIMELNRYAKKIGERQYNAEFIKYEDDEIGQLAETMHLMAQKLEVYDSTIKTFLQNASHELRTPLMSIQGYAEGIKYGVVDNKESAVDIIIEESNRLSELVEDLLYLSKIDTMEDLTDIEEINAGDLLKSSIERVNGIAVKNKKLIKLSIKQPNINIQGDEEKLTRAIINILGNCLRYAEKVIGVELNKEGQKIVIIIKDDGRGFNEKDLDNIFNRFFKGEGGNYGLGLAITKSIIEKHGGTIEATNNSEGGACFKIIL